MRPGSAPAIRRQTALPERAEGVPLLRWRNQDAALSCPERSLWSCHALPRASGLERRIGKGPEKSSVKFEHEANTGSQINQRSDGEASTGREGSRASSGREVKPEHTDLDLGIGQDESLVFI